ncbi:hypothetical protein J6590_065127 [Homalodisca vitripennis]|nr:hypothetical protein J6590_065127 [Homalodisca vitripennis]
MHPLGKGRLTLWNWETLNHAKAVCGTILDRPVETGHSQPGTTTTVRTSVDPGVQSKAGPPLAECLTSVYPSPTNLHLGSPKLRSVHPPRTQLSALYRSQNPDCLCLGFHWCFQTERPISMSSAKPAMSVCSGAGHGTFGPRILVTKQISGSKNTKKESGDNINKVEVSENPNKTETKKREEELDSEAEIEMLTDMTKLKKKTLSRRLTSVASSGEESESENDSGSDQVVNIRKAKKYNNESKKRREEERNELFRFLDSNCSSEEEVDISKKDLDVIEDQYGSSSESMTFEDFSQKMLARMHKQQREQEEMNLKILLAPDSDEVLTFSCTNCGRLYCS